ncbi:MAG: DnaJ domain-containing protein [Rickettsiales bacterium]|nr:DnaJ domain-containing protein [Rickettsiales bacterium]
MWIISFCVSVLSLMLIMRARKSTRRPTPQPDAEQEVSNDILKNAMDRNTAREVLGINAEANKREIIAAHRRLMRHIHPDRGGSAYLASQINQAKEVLIKGAHRQRG